MIFRLKSGVALAALCTAIPAYAQTTGAAPAPTGSSSQSTPLGGNESATTATQVEPPELSAPTEAKDQQDIVVTGTNIRGVAPAGTESIVITAEDIKEAGGLTTNDVLARIPQTSNFNKQIVAAPGQPHNVDTPAIHGLPALIMLDGHRIAAAGTSIIGVDPSIIPKGVLSSIEIVPDGGSAIYGSDAVGGVINMTTKKRFDGIDIDGTVGFADNYRSYRIDATVGKTWSTGSIYLAYAYDEQTPIYGYQRPYLQRIPQLTECFPGTVNADVLLSIPGVGTFPVAIGTYHPTGFDASGRPSGFATGAASCNEYTNETVTPEEHMHSVFAGLSQDLSSSIRMDLRAFYSTRRSLSKNNFYTYTDATVPTSNFYYTGTPSFEQFIPGGSQSVGISFNPAIGPNQSAPNRLDTWGTSAEIAADLGHSFQLRFLGNYSESFVDTTLIGVDSNLLASSLASSDPNTALDPYNVAANPASATIAREIDDQVQRSQGHMREAQARLVADGTLFHLPGGDVKIAVGGEVLNDQFNTLVRNTTFDGSAYIPLQITNGTRTVASAFGELNIPLVAPDNNVPLVYRLTASVTGRYDHYSDFGGTFNPRFAASWLPVEWLTLRATYGHSFVAPALAQEFTVQTAGVSTAIPFLLPPNMAGDAGRNFILVGGGNPDLKPQKARTWSVGADVRVPFLRGLKAGVTYYNAYYQNQITAVPFFSPSQFYTPTYAAFYVLNPTQAQAAAVIGDIPVNGNGFTSLSQLYTTPGASPAILIDDRFQNLGLVRTDGLDFNADYLMKTSFGSLNLAAAGNYVLNNQASPAPGQLYADQLTTMSRFTGSITGGANVGPVRFSANLLHTSGFGITAGTSPTGQTRVKSYDTVNTFLSYTFKEHGLLNGTELSLNVENLLDVRPAVDTAVNLGYTGGSIIGRTFELGLHKKF